MPTEYLLLYILLYKSAFHEYKDEVDLKKIKETSREVSFLFNALYALHDKVEQDLTVDELAAFFWAKYPDSDRDIYGNILTILKTINVSKESASTIVAEYKLRKLAASISDKAMQVALNGGELTEVKELLSTVSDTQVDDGGVSLVSDDLVSLIGDKFLTGGLQWRLSCLNYSLGPLRDGDFGFIFARPETGKTTFLASEISSMLKDIDRPVCWFNNEEQGYKVKLRVIQSWFGITTTKLLGNLARYQAEFVEQTNGKFLLFDGAQIHYKAVEKLVSKYNPSLVIYDQLTKITGFQADRKDLELGDKFQWARELAKNNHAAIGVSQADGTAEGVRYIGMEHVANAKTSVQAEADFVLGIGDTRTGDDIRYLCISKNKLLGAQSSKEELRHGRFEVLIQAQIGRYKDLISYD